MKCWILDLDDTVANTTRDMRGDASRLALLTPAEGARDFLNTARARGDRCVLVTTGDWPLQTKKLNLLNLPFEATRILPSSGKADVKRNSFLDFVKKAEGMRVIVVGDRLDRDIAVAKSLNLLCVRMCLPYGKYVDDEPQSEEETPDFTVRNFLELMQLPFFLHD